MLLREIQILLTNHVNSLTPQLQGLGGGMQDFINRDAAREAATALASVPSLSTLASTVLGQEAFRTQTTVIDQNQAGGLRAALSALAGACTPILAFLNATLPREPEFYMAVRLPPRDDAGTDLVAKALNGIHVALDQPLRRLGYEPVKISLVQPGSVWLEVATATGAALGILGSILTFAIARVKLTQEQTRLESERAKAHQEQARLEQERLKVEAEQSRAEQESIKLELARLEARRRELELRTQIQQIKTDQAIAEFIAAHGASPEAEAALRMGVEETVALLQSGSEVRLQLNAPERISRYFPAEAIPDRHGVPAKLLASEGDLPRLPPALKSNEI